MKNEQQTQSIFFLQVLAYGTCFVLVVGLLATVGKNMLLAQVLLTSTTDTAYIQKFAHVNGTLFWWALAITFSFMAFCSTFFRWVQLLPMTKKPLSKKNLFTKFLHVFVTQWGLVIFLVLLCWSGGRFVVRYMTPVIQQESLYENRAEYRLEHRIQFSPSIELKES